MAPAAILNFGKMLIITTGIKQLSPNFNSIHLVPATIDAFGQICKFYKIEDGGGRHLGFRIFFLISAGMKQLSQNFNSLHLVGLPASVIPDGSDMPIL
jgi:hypothetical protein